MSPTATGAVLHDVTQALARPAGALAAAAFDVLTHVRRGKPIHTRGLVTGLRLVRTGGQRRWGVPWLDEPGEHRGLARLSKSAGLPDLLPDVMGLAIRFHETDGTHDLLLASTGMQPVLRHLVIVGREPLAVSYGSLLPYSAHGRPVLLAAVPTAPVHVRLTDLPRVLAERPVVLDLLVASPLGGWDAFGWCELTARPDDQPGDEDLALRFDPVLHPLPGLSPTAAHAATRLPAYLTARRVSGGSAEDAPTG